MALVVSPLVALAAVVVAGMALHLALALLVGQDMWRFIHGKDIRNY